VSGANQSWLSVLLIIAFSGLLAGLIGVTARDWRRRGVTGAPPLTPRDAALEALDELLSSGAHRDGRVREFFTRSSEITRRYVEVFDARWGPDWTSTELMGGLQGHAPGAAADHLDAEMASAEAVKFGGRRPESESAEEHWRTVHDWIEQTAEPTAGAGDPEAESGEAEPEPTRHGTSDSAPSPPEPSESRSGGSPVWLWLAVALVPLGWWLMPRRTSGIIIARAEEPVDVRRQLGILETLPLMLRLGAMAALVIALAGPQMVRVYDEPQVEGVGIALALDLSTSMWAEDMGARQSRLEVAKTTALRFIDARTDDIGLVSFAGEAFARLPLTHDGYVVKEAVRGLEVGLLTDGTDIAGAIAAGAGLLADAPHASKVLILVTDGAHNKAGVLPDLAARAAATVGVTIYPVAIGQEQGRDTRSMETVLTQAARITGGRYFKATDVSALDAIYEEIDRLVQPSEETVQRIETTAYAWVFALLALALLMLGSILRGSRWGVLP